MYIQLLQPGVKLAIWESESSPWKKEQGNPKKMKLLLQEIRMLKQGLTLRDLGSGLSQYINFLKEFMSQSLSRQLFAMSLLCADPACGLRERV